MQPTCCGTATHNSLLCRERFLDALGPDGALYQSARPGNLGGHRRSKLYGRLDCRSALQALARGGYARDRVFFLDEHAAQSRRLPAVRGVCLPDQYAAWF